MRDAALAEAERWKRNAGGHDAYAIAAQRDAALAALAKVFALHAPGEQYVEPNGGATLTRCQGCDDDWPCETMRLLP